MVAKVSLDTSNAFIDIEKVFDKVGWQQLFKALMEIGLKFKDRDSEIIIYI